MKNEDFAFECFSEKGRVFRLGIPLITAELGMLFRLKNADRRSEAFLQWLCRETQDAFRTRGEFVDNLLRGQVFFQSSKRRAESRLNRAHAEVGILKLTNLVLGVFRTMVANNGVNGAVFQTLNQRLAVVLPAQRRQYFEIRIE